MTIWTQVPLALELSHLLLQAPKETATDSGSDVNWIVLLLGSGVASAIGAGIVTSVLQHRFNRTQKRDDARLELRLRSLNEFYAPLKTLLDENKVLAQSLRAEFSVPDGTEWHALDNLDAIKASPSALKIAQEILAINGRIGAILETKSGLDLGELQYIPNWEVHRRLFAQAFEEGAGDIKRDLAFFPPKFEVEVNEIHRSLLAEVKSSVGIETRKKETT